MRGLAGDTLNKQRDKPAWADTKTLALKFVDWRNSVSGEAERAGQPRPATLDGQTEPPRETAVFSRQT